MKRVNERVFIGRWLRRHGSQAVGGNNRDTGDDNKTSGPCQQP